MSLTANSDDRGRFSTKCKTDAVLRLLRGEDLELLSRELGVTAATLSAWRDDFLAGGQAALKSRPADDRDEEIARLRAKWSISQLTVGLGLPGQVHTRLARVPSVEALAAASLLANRCRRSNRSYLVNRQSNGFGCLFVSSS